MENDLILKVSQQIGLLSWNFEEINAALDANLERYRNLVVTEKDIRDAKDIKARLNHLKAEIETRRKEAKKEFCQPYEDFAAQVKETVAKIDDVYTGIDAQVKAFEDAEKEQKRKTIEQWWNENCKTDPFVGFELVFDKGFLKKSCTATQWKRDLRARFEQINKDFETIRNYQDDKKRDFVLASYMNSIDLGAALRTWEQYVDQLQKAENFRKQAELRAQEAERQAAERQRQAQEAAKQAELRAQEAERQAAERQRQAQEAAKQANTEPKTEPQQTAHEPAKQADTQVYRRIMEVYGTREQIIALAEFMNKTGIKFRKVEK